MGKGTEESSYIMKEPDHLSIPVHLLKQNIKDFENAWIEVIENNVNYQVRLAVKKYRQIESGKLTVVGAIEDLTDVCQSGIWPGVFYQSERRC